MTALCTCGWLKFLFLLLPLPPTQPLLLVVVLLLLLLLYALHETNCVTQIPFPHFHLRKQTNYYWHKKHMHALIILFSLQNRNDIRLKSCTHNEIDSVRVSEWGSYEWRLMMWVQTHALCQEINKRIKCNVLLMLEQRDIQTNGKPRANWAQQNWVVSVRVSRWTKQKRKKKKNKVTRNMYISERFLHRRFYVNQCKNVSIFHRSQPEFSQLPWDPLPPDKAP